MKSVKRILVGIGIMAICFGLTPVAWGGGPAENIQCLLTQSGKELKKALKDAIPIQGTVALELVSGDEFQQDIDFLLRLRARPRDDDRDDDRDDEPRSSSNQHSFRLHLLTTEFGAVSIEGAVCRIVNPGEWTDGSDEQNAVSQLVTEILTQFNIPLDWKLVITKKSITGNEVTGTGDPNLVNILITIGTPDLQGLLRAFTMFEVKLYAVPPAP